MHLYNYLVMNINKLRNMHKFHVKTKWNLISYTSTELYNNITENI